MIKQCIDNNITNHRSVIRWHHFERISQNKSFNDSIVDNDPNSELTYSKVILNHFNIIKNLRECKKFINSYERKLKCQNKI